MKTRRLRGRRRGSLRRTPVQRTASPTRLDCTLAELHALYMVVNSGQTRLVTALSSVPCGAALYPDSCMLEACNAPESDVDSLNAGTLPWKELLPQTRLEADSDHVFERGLSEMGPVTHVKLNIYPDGGVARLRVWGVPERLPKL